MATLLTLDETRPVIVALHHGESDPLLPPPAHHLPTTASASAELEPSYLYSAMPSYSSFSVAAADEASPSYCGTATEEDNDEENAREEEEEEGSLWTSDMEQRGSIRLSFFQTMQEGAASIVECVQESVVLEFAQGLQLQIAEQVADVTDALLQELQQADDDDTFFLEMGLSRNLSILPTDVVEVAQTVTLVSEEAQQEAPQEKKQLLDHQQQNRALEQSIEIFPGRTRQLSVRSKSSIKFGGDKEGEQEIVVLSTPPPVHPGLGAYILLATAVVAMSSLGPFLNLQHNCTPTMKVTWRTCGTACMLLPFCWLEVNKLGRPKMTFPQWTTFVLSTISFVTLIVAFVLALQYTTVGNAVILSNSQAILLLFGKFVVGSPVTLLEGSGALMAFLGAVLCSVDSAKGDSQESSVASHLGGFTSSSTMLGDAFGLLAGVGGVMYLVLAKAVRAHMPLYTFMFLTMSLGCILCVAAQILILGETVTMDFHYEHGIFGFLNPVLDRLPVELFIVVICNMLGSLGYIRAMQFFDNLVISVATLMTPVFAELMACLMGVSTLPGFVGWLGNALVATGTLAVVYPTPGEASS